MQTNLRLKLATYMLLFVCFMASAQRPVFTTTNSVTTVEEGGTYKYSIEVSSKFQEDLSLTSNELPDWLKLKSTRVSTHSGGTSGGIKDGKGENVRYYILKSIVCDSQGNLFITDRNVIRKITPDGTVSTFAGRTDTDGSFDAKGTKATFNDPRGLAIGKGDTLYVADHGSSKIRKVAPDGTVTSLPQRADSPRGIAFDSKGNLYFSQRDRIQKITPEGELSTYVRDIRESSSLVFDKDDNLYAIHNSSSSGGVVWKIPPIEDNDARKRAIRKYADYSPGRSTSSLSHLVFDKVGNLYISYLNGIKKVDLSTNKMTDFTGAFEYNDPRRLTDGSKSEAEFYQISGLAFDKDENLFVLDYGNYKLRKISANETAVLTGTPNNSHAGDTVKVKLEVARGEEKSSQSFEIRVMDTTPSKITTFFPEDDTEGLHIPNHPVITFNERIKKGTGNITIYNDTDSKVFEAISVGSDQIVISSEKKVDIKLKKPLLYGKSYHIKIDAGAFETMTGTDHPGILTADKWNFKTKELKELKFTSKPEVSSMDEYKYFNYEFSTAHHNEDDFVSFSLENSPSWFSIVGKAVVGTAPHSALGLNKVVLVATHKDGRKIKQSFEVTVKDPTPSTIKYTYPLDERRAIPIDTTLHIVFNEKVLKGSTGSIRLYDKEKNLVVDSIHISSSAITIKEDTVTIALKNKLKNNTAYYAILDDGAFTNESGLSNDGITDKTKWEFHSKVVFRFTSTPLKKVDENNKYTYSITTKADYPRYVRVNTTTPSWLKTIRDGREIKLEGTPSHKQVGEHGVEITATHEGETIKQKFKINVIDPNPPTLSKISPSQEEGKFTPVDFKKFTIKFNEKVNKGKGFIRVYNVADNSVLEKIDVTSDKVSLVSDSAVINTSATYKENSTYYVKMDTGTFKDPSNNSFEGILSTAKWRFKTKTGDFEFITSPDTVIDEGEKYTYLVESNDLNKNVTLKALNLPDWLKLSKTKPYIISGNTDKQVGDHPVALEFTNKQELKIKQEFTIKVKDITNPFVKSYSPRAKSSGVYVPVKQLTMTFDENIQKGTGKIMLYDQSNDKLVESINVNSEQVKLSFKQATIDLPDELGNDKKYYIKVDKGIFKNVSGLEYEGIDDKTTWSFAMNRVPKFTSSPVTVASSNKKYLYKLAASDADKDSLMFSSVVLPSWMSLTSRGVTTFTGKDTEGDKNGKGKIAQFDSPRHIAIDKDGNLFVADYDNHKIKKIAPNGKVTTYAGSEKGFANGDKSKALFEYPYGIATDIYGNVYVTDLYRLRKIAASGTVSTLYRSRSLRDVAVDKEGNIYVVAGNSIQKIEASSGEVKTVANSNFDRPDGIDVDRYGNIYVADTRNYRIKKVTPKGVVTTIAGSIYGDKDGEGSDAEFKYPRGIVLGKDGNLYVADNHNNKIKKVTLSGKVTTIAGGGFSSTDVSNPLSSKLSGPYGIAIDDKSTIYITDNNSKIRKIAKVSELSGNKPEVGGNKVIIKVSDGNGGSSQQSFAVAVDGKKAPSINAFFPADDAVDVKNVDQLTLEFNVDILKGTGKIKIYYLSSANTYRSLHSIDVASSKVSVTNNKATIKIGTELLYGKKYYVTIEKGAFKSKSNLDFEGFTSSQRWNFSIEKLKSFQSISFENIPAIDLNLTNKVVLKATSTSKLPVAFELVKGKGTIDGNLLTVTEPGTLEVKATQKGNKDYNAAKPVVREIVVKKPENKVPKVRAFLPADDSNDISITNTKELKITFDRAVKIGKGNVTLLDASKNALETIDVVSDKVKIINDDVVTVKLSKTLALNTRYHVKISEGAFTNLYGLSYAGIKDSSTWNFTTERVKRQDQTITFENIPNVDFSKVKTLNLTAKASSNLPVIFTLVKGNGSLSGNVLSIKGTGVFEVRAEQKGNEKFNAATPVTITFNVINKKPLGVNDNETVIVLYPNPASDFVSISNTEIVKTIIYSVQGREVLTSTNRTINVSELPNGVYSVKMIDEKGNEYFDKLIIE